MTLKTSRYSNTTDEHRTLLLHFTLLAALSYRCWFKGLPEEQMRSVIVNASMIQPDCKKRTIASSVSRSEVTKTVMEQERCDTSAKKR
ncbi:hypothetical protein E2C01_038538 [Portunus trituberculatus]|uniref:Uncharacterized protein n=1 Tax=Portunus trituberculatus TaxID=210409 RepID=A0A5B7FH31_PORTR|nr:hypothetical protein [Portunus trituberculatus]